MLNRRHRRGYYSIADPSPLSSLVRRAVALFVIGLLLFLAGTKILRLFGIGNVIRQSAVVLTLENRHGAVSVSIEGKEFQRAEDQLKLYPGDLVRTSSRANAVLSLFDGTEIRLDESTEISLLESAHGEDESEFLLELMHGSLWIAIPTMETFSGSITRQIRTHDLNIILPSKTEAVISASSIVIFAADDLGATIWLTGRGDPILIGEGQQFSVPADTVISGNPYHYRSPLDPLVIRSPFVEESRNMHASKRESAEGEPEEPEMPSDEFLAVTEPQDGVLVKTSTVHVAGKVGEGIVNVRINGYLVSLDEAHQTFSQDLALPDEDEISIVIEALAEDGTVREELRRTVRRDRKPPAAPVITSPASKGQTYLTSRETIEIIGKATGDTIGIVVNDYRLQLFQPGDETWTYLASIQLDNLHEGKNVYEVIAINKGGYKSKPSVITVILGEGEEGIIEEESKEAKEAKESKEEAVEETELPNNIPALPGSLAVVGPTPGTFHSATGSSFLIEGATSERTHSVWVNNYQLRLYKPGKTFWNYIADTKLGTLRRGTNIYHITARDKDGEILDEIEYTAHLDPRQITE